MAPNPPGVARRAILMRDGSTSAEDDAIAEEVPIALEYNCIAHVVMFATPAYLEDFARGFTLSEAIVTSPGQIYSIEVLIETRGIRVAIEIASGCLQQLKARRRALTGRTGCGLCGVESLEHAVRELAVLPWGFTVADEALTKGMGMLRERQVLMQATGALHAAGWIDPTGQLLLVREDVGRHNALDKLIGAMAAASVDCTLGAALITSRASFEMVQKAVTLQIPVLAAISAPTALAIDMAVQSRLCLIGFVRGAHYACYSAKERLTVSISTCQSAHSIQGTSERDPL